MTWRIYPVALQGDELCRLSATCGPILVELKGLGHGAKIKWEGRIRHTEAPSGPLRTSWKHDAPVMALSVLLRELAEKLKWSGQRAAGEDAVRASKALREVNWSTVGIDWSTLDPD